MNLMKKHTNTAEKSYDRCLSCQHRGMRCNGPRTADLPLERWCEYMRDMKEASHLTNAEIAEKSGVSLKTIERLMALNVEQDIMRDTARRIESAIIGSERKYPCILAFQEAEMPDDKRVNDTLRELEHALADNREYKTTLDNIHASYKEEMETIRDEAKKKIDYLVDLVAKLRADNDNLWRLINHMTKDDKL